MGNFSSKIFPELENDGKSSVQLQVKMSALEKNQMCTPVMSMKMSNDPRSATAGITRTPIEIASTPPRANKKVASAIPKYLRVKQYLETNLDLILPAVTPEKRVPDPRSPNVNHERTPIMVKTTSGYISPIVTVQEGPDMLTPDAFDPRSPATAFDRTPIARSRPSNPPSEGSTPKDTASRMSYCETTGEFNIPEIQTIPTFPTITIAASKNLEECMRACDLENAESNLDECPEDEVLHSEESEAEDQITVIPNVRGIPELEEEEMKEKSPGEEPQVTLDPSKVPSKPQTTGDKGLIRVWRDSVSPLPPADPQGALREDSTPPEEVMIEFDDETVVKSSQPNASKPIVRLDDKSKLQIVNKQIKKIQTSKKEVKGVFEDVNIDAGKSRTPLACRSNHKSGNPSKSPQQVLRAKGLSTKPRQQENTPPNTKRFRTKVKGNGTQWDPDMTVII
ncbi:uncharacterized protein LOC107045706 [Diachasma alloeum]|uniref:uncharacterized protein LOC107045706 n=1 Tax=Diachasma alloeum TaxID=454923 RepID=UPI00073824DE|nr:uncharacterized protein LOC107045706 [Diachasma alloeum]